VVELRGRGPGRSGAGGRKARSAELQAREAFAVREYQKAERRRFEHLWGWSYRFEAYTPAGRRVRGYYAMSLLWGDRVIGWANVSVASGA
jgi:hypothetical protein